MAYRIPDLDTEIVEKVAWLRAHNGDELRKAWLITAVMADHDDVEGSDAEFAICGAHFAVTRRVESFFRTLAPGAADSNPWLPGFERLRREYLVKRNNEIVAVSVFKLTYAELTDKAEECRHMAAGNLAHADELIRFRDEQAAEEA